MEGKRRKSALSKKISTTLIVVLIAVGTVVIINLDDISYHFASIRSRPDGVEPSYEKEVIALTEEELLRGIKKADLESLDTINYELDTDGTVKSVYFGQPTEEDRELHEAVYRRVLFNIYGRDFNDIVIIVVGGTYHRALAPKPILLDAGNSVIEYFGSTRSSNVFEMNIKL
ncbi:hypothetical protein KC717_00585 [Candidatus Dojkabacteria bacterium]|uniref:Uncharacterized protein n=1 Tax=Candidatus Dojkabacteria bacterium TaxID=2099670 RepID=A0A955L7T5_9BACT|nr:hypothetical protein [Candidatus Dojkabacteria bacterium]